MNNQQSLARKWAEEAKRAAPRHKYTDETRAAIEHIMATTTPPSMADVEWDHEKYHLAGAYLNTSNRDAVMIGTWDDQIVTVDVPRESDRSSIPLMSMVTRNGVTPNGKRYELREVSDEHPTALYTVEDYENAPAGTIVAPADRHAWTKAPSGAWRQGKDCRTSREMAGAEREMLRWGWGE